MFQKNNSISYKHNSLMISVFTHINKIRVSILKYHVCRHHHQVMDRKGSNIGQGKRPQ